MNGGFRRKFRGALETLISIVLVIGFVSCTVAIAASPSPGLPTVVKLVDVGRSTIYRLHDAETGADCYIVPAEIRLSENTGPAVSCVK